jgi:hypothetical protein
VITLFFSIPKIIRRYFLYDRKLLGKLSQCATSSLTSFFRITLGKKMGIPGIALAIQTFGDYATSGIRMSMLWWRMDSSPRAGIFM